MRDAPLDALAPHEQQTLAELEQLCEQARLALPGAPVPCFAHLRIDSGRRVRDLLLGWRTLAGSSGPVTILHWQTAPLAALFFANREGDAYELEAGEKTLEGTVLARNLLDFEAGVLVEVITQDAVLSRRGGGPWRRVADAPPPLLLPRLPGAGRTPPPWTREALDAEQRRAVEMPPSRPLLVLGEAGCGKTTVALHRLAYLREKALAAGRPFRALVLVPAASAGLRHLSQTLLARLGAPETEVQVFDRWAGAQARRAFSRLPERESREVSAAVVNLKRHPALRDVLPELARRPRKGRAAKLTATRQDLLHLFGDAALLERVAAASGGAISGGAVHEVLEHTRIQFSATSEQEFAHVDAERLVTVDGRLIDEETPMEDAGSIDAEDYAVLFALSALRSDPAHGRASPEPTSYDCVVLDEAQEFAPLELALIGRAVRPGGTLIVAGDEAQQVDPSAYFAGWEETMRTLAAPDFDREHLLVSYRCPPAVTAFARVVRSGAGSALAAAAGDAAVQSFAAPSELHLHARLIDSLRELRERDPSAVIAIICRLPASAQRLHQLLVRGIDARLVEGGDFRFAPGIEVTCVQEVKGLEFDYVILPDADSASYPDGGAARRALYVAATRASQQLLLACAARPSPLLSP